MLAMESLHLHSVCGEVCVFHFIEFEREVLKG